MKYVYAFGGGTAEGSGDQKFLLGGKGAGLAEMSRLGIPVPPGFTLSTEACKHYLDQGGVYPQGLIEEVAEHLTRVEELLGQKFAGDGDPLLFSVRSGGAHSMPGMMDTVLNLGLNDEIVRALDAGGPEDERFYRDCYRRLVAMYADVVLGVPEEELVAVMRSEVKREGSHDHGLSPAALDRVIAGYQEVIERHGKVFPVDPRDQLWGAIGAVFDSWNNRRAREYRRLHGIAEDMGTGVNIQAMVFGNRGPDCATGVAFTRDPANGEQVLYGEFLTNCQGEDIVAGTHTPRPIRGDGRGDGGLAAEFPDAHAELERVSQVLERHFRNMQDLEFTIQHEELYMLQTREGKRSGPAAVRIAVDMVNERLIDRREALRRVEPHHLVQMMAPVFDQAGREQAVAAGRLLARGLSAGPGAASGRIALTAERAADMARSGPVLLVRNETSPEDIVGMHASVGILTTRGGMTSHAAVVARGLGKPCVVGADQLVVDEEAGEVRVDGKVFCEGDEMSIDGTAGEVLVGAIKAQPSAVLAALLDRDAASSTSPSVQSFLTLLGWADRERRLGVRANADTPEDAAIARIFGAEGIGLCRTEHMFFEQDRIPWVQRMILGRNEAERNEALAHLLPVQQGDFEGIFRALAGLPVTIRLLDPPLHEFLPKDERAIGRLAKSMGLEIEALHDKVETLVETNPMLGHRGCRLGVTAPEIYEMQVEAIARAAIRVAADGIEVKPEIMVPLVGVEAEIEMLRRRIETVVERVQEGSQARIDFHIGTMIEVPRAALVADRIAHHADFFSFGTNDLTQMTFGYSRDDAGRFLPEYLEDHMLPFDPFGRLDEAGVGQLVELGCQRGRMAKPDLKIGVCGEHGGEPNSIDFFERCGLDYVSCSPYRLPIARLAAARAHLGFGPGG